MLAAHVPARCLTGPFGARLAIWRADPVKLVAVRQRDPKECDYSLFQGSARVSVEGAEGVRAVL